MMKDKFKAPKFWEQDGIIAKLLSPLSGIYASKTAKRLAETKGYKAKIPVICVGNLVAGGAGKTPIALYIAKQLIADGKKPHFLCSDYAGEVETPQKVESGDCAKYGDEAVLLSKTAPTWVGSDRAATAKLAQKAGAEILIMDDGFQNPSLKKDFSIVVIDGAYGFGNGRVIPAGPLREPIDVGLKRADCIVVMGEEAAKLPATELPKFSAKLEIEYEESLQADDVIAFCAIARPQKFYDALRAKDLKIVQEFSFPDHHLYSEEDLKKILNAATERQAIAVTTEKDYVKIPKQLRVMLHLVKAEAVFAESEKFMAALNKKINAKNS